MDKKVISKIIKSYRKEENKYILTVSRDVVDSISAVIPNMPFELRNLEELTKEVICKLFADYKRIKYSIADNVPESHVTYASSHLPIDYVTTKKYNKNIGKPDIEIELEF